MSDPNGTRASVVPKAPTGVVGLDAATRGGIPRASATLVEGGPGAGKTVLSLQSLAYAAQTLDEPGIFVAFEENSARIVANAASFAWNLASLQKKSKLFFIDAQPSSDLVQSGDFDLRGLLAALDAKIAQMGARRIVFDALDVVLSLLPDAAAERRELYRLRDWLLTRGITALITSKAGPGSSRLPAEFMQFMMDCAIQLEHHFVKGVSQRSLRILKYRGSEFHENEAPFVIGEDGLDVAAIQMTEHARPPVSGERLSSGVARLDAMLGGGYFRGSSILLTGVPGTAKTTLCAAFVEAACLRGEATLFVSFDSAPNELIRNVRSVGIRLERFRAKGRRRGLLCMSHGRAVIGSAETHLLQIMNLARKHEARCIVIDPVSALVQAGNITTGHGVAERLIDWAKVHGITLLCSSLVTEASSPDDEATPLQISTIADTWIHLRYLVRGGERNRALSILKSRGTAHSNQVRELLLSDRGITLADAYNAGGEVLMGTLRWEREQAEQTLRQEAEVVTQEARLKLLNEGTELAARLAALHIELDAKHADLKALTRGADIRDETAAGRRTERRSRRGADLELVKPNKTAGK